MVSGSGDGSLATSPSPPGRSRVHVVKHCAVSEEALSFKVSPVPASLAHRVQCIDSSPSIHETKPIPVILAAIAISHMLSELLLGAVNVCSSKYL